MSTRTIAVARGVGVIGSTIAVVAGVTFAQLTAPPVTLSDNTISSATASLKIKSTGGVFGLTATGFDFNEIIPGGPAVPEPGNTFSLLNDGTVDLALTVKIPKETTDTPKGAIDKTKVHILIKRSGGTVPADSYKLSDLEATDANLPLEGTLASGVTGVYQIQVKMDHDAVTGSHAELGPFDLVFSGTPPTTTPPPPVPAP